MSRLSADKAGGNDDDSESENDWFTGQGFFLAHAKSAVPKRRWQ
jgi:hypothetical protein